MQPTNEDIAKAIESFQNGTFYSVVIESNTTNKIYLVVYKSITYPIRAMF